RYIAAQQMEADHVILLESLHEMAVVDLWLNLVHISAQNRTREENGKLQPGPGCRRQRMIHGVIAERRRDRRRSNSLQAVRALPVDVQEIEIVVVLGRCICQCSYVLNAVPIAVSNTREASP